MEKINNQQFLEEQRSEWRRKNWSIPDIRGEKFRWFDLVTGLINEIGEKGINNLDSIPNISKLDNLQTWRVYATFFKGLGLVNNTAGTLGLSENGKLFLNNLTKRKLADIIHEKVKLFGEVLNLISKSPITIKNANEIICNEYQLNWNNLSHIRQRFDWLEVLEMIQPIGDRKWEVTDKGKKALKDWLLISPMIMQPLDPKDKEINISNPPKEIAKLLNNLFEFPELLKKRNTYNIWAPSPNRIEKLRIIVQATTEKISRDDLFSFICSEFNLKKSSVESMLPFLRACGYIEEVGRNIYMATLPAKEWIETGDDLDFIRILHAHMQFVGEMLEQTKQDIIRNDLYVKAQDYGLNVDKTRWIAGLLIEAGLLEEGQYLHLKATPLGIKFMLTLPLLNINSLEEKQSDKIIEKYIDDPFERIVNRLENTARDPFAEKKIAGLAFEEAIAEIMRFMGFEVTKVGGSGDTDVLVEWYDNKKNKVRAIIDGKSKSTGQVHHSDVSDVAIDTHKDKNKANYVAIIGPNFSGETIISHALKKNIALITTEQLIKIAKASRDLGLSLEEIALIFKVPNGYSQLNLLIKTKKRELDIITNVITKFCKEQNQLGPLSPRDLFLLLKDTEGSPTLEELIDVFKILSNADIGILHQMDKNRLPENTMYLLYGGKKAVYRLQALATIIDKSMF